MIVQKLTEMEILCVNMELIIRETEMRRKTTVNWRDCILENLDMARKGNLKRETESLLLATQNNAIRINYIKAKIDNTQHHSKYRLYDNKDKTVNYIISECSKLAQKEYKTRHNWVGKVILPNVQTRICSKERDS